MRLCLHKSRHRWAVINAVVSSYTEYLPVQLAAFLLTNLLCQNKLSRKPVLWLGSHRHLFLLKRGGFHYSVLISRIYLHWFLFFLNMSEFSPAGGTKLGLGTDHTPCFLGLVAWIPLFLSCWNYLEKMEGLGCSISKLKSTQSAGSGASCAASQGLLSSWWKSCSAWAKSPSFWHVSNHSGWMSQVASGLRAVCSDVPGKRKSQLYVRVFKGGRGCFSPGPYLAANS